jgi:hypothetical protein
LPVVRDGFECEKFGRPLLNDDRPKLGGLLDVFDIKTKEFEWSEVEEYGKWSDLENRADGHFRPIRQSKMKREMGKKIK